MYGGSTEPSHCRCKALWQASRDQCGVLDHPWWIELVAQRLRRSQFDLKTEIAEYAAVQADRDFPPSIIELGHVPVVHRTHELVFAAADRRKRDNDGVFRQPRQ